MNRKIKRQIIIFIVISLMAQLASGQSNKLKYLIKPEQIDPLDPHAGDFLYQDHRQLVQKAEDYYNEGDYKKAARQYLYALHFNREDNISMYNLACCYGLMDEPELAARYLRLAMVNNFPNVDLIRNDTDFDKVKTNKRFKAVLDSLPEYYKQANKGDGKTLFFDACAIFQCQLYLPNNYDKTKTYPLVVGLHGYGDAADRFVENWFKFDNPQFIFAVPYAPYHFFQSNRIAYSWNLWLPGDDEFPGQDFYITEDYIINLINALKKYSNIGDVYLLGHSQGAATTYITGITHHEIFKGLIPMAGPLNPFWLGDSLLNAGKDLNLMIVHGKNDNSIKYDEGKSAERLLKNYGYSIEFVEFDGGHEYPPEKIFRKIQKWIEKKN